MRFVDSHGHLTDEKFQSDLNEVIERAKNAGVCRMISAGYDVQSSLQALCLSAKHKEVFATAGIHPENLANFEELFSGTYSQQKFEDFLQKNMQNVQKQMEKLQEIAKNDKVVAIGEIGLDYHFFDEIENEKQKALAQNLTEEEIFKLKELQKFAFEKQIELAEKLSLPIVVHSRDAMGDTIEILQKFAPKRESLLHCFGGSVESAKILMKLGFCFSFGGISTFKNAKTVKEVLANLPAEKILLETDCPYLAPEPFRGTRNEPKNLPYIADAIARLRGESIEEVAETTTKNAERIFDFTKV